MKKKSFVFNNIITVLCYVFAIVMFGAALWQLLTRFADEATYALCYCGTALTLIATVLKIVLDKKCKKQYKMLEEEQIKIAEEKALLARQQAEEKARMEWQEQERRRAAAEQEQRRRELELAQIKEAEEMLAMERELASFDYPQNNERCASSVAPQKKNTPNWG